MFDIGYNCWIDESEKREAENAMIVFDATYTFEHMGYFINLFDKAKLKKIHKIPQIYKISEEAKESWAKNGVTLTY